jgi:hypothetical protein
VYEFEDDDLARADDLDFLDELRTADLGQLWRRRVILDYGAAPRWQVIAIERAISRAFVRQVAEPKALEANWVNQLPGQYPERSVRGRVQGQFALRTAVDPVVVLTINSFRGEISLLLARGPGGHRSRSAWAIRR